jgi:predicted ribosome quality control (RQC) complex YloA/Tae2 family protein
MVFFFKSTECHPAAEMYMGKDKFENEELIKWATGHDFWFHVDDLSSAHVYLKPLDGWSLDTIPKAVLQDCAQLTKANSIQGSKLPSVRIVYTPASNLRKEKSFEVGQVAFHNEKLVCLALDQNIFYSYIN